MIHPEKEYLKHCRTEIETKLSDINLSLNKKTQLFPLSQNINWLKWRFELTDTGRVIRHPGRASLSRERRRLKNLKHLIDSGRLPAKSAADSYLSWAACMERRKAQKNYDKRRGGKRIRDGPAGRAVETMRDFFIRIYGFDHISKRRDLQKRSGVIFYPYRRTKCLL